MASQTAESATQNPELLQLLTKGVQLLEKQTTLLEKHTLLLEKFVHEEQCVLQSMHVPSTAPLIHPWWWRVWQR